VTEQLIAAAALSPLKVIPHLIAVNSYPSDSIFGPTYIREEAVSQMKLTKSKYHSHQTDESSKYCLQWGLRAYAVAQWLRHCATSWKVVGSIPDYVIEIFHRHNPSGCTMALGSAQRLTEMSTRNISWG
jgi:hypothetical protein